MACGVALGSACSGAEAPPEASIVASGRALGPSEVSGALVFGGGVTLSRIEIGPPSVAPGEDVKVAFELQGPPLDLVIALRPPRAASFQVALGGVDAPSPERPEDPRIRSITHHAATGRVEATLRLPQPWHPATVVVTVQHAPRGRAAPTRVTSGPRTHDDLGILGILDVQPTPTRALVRSVAPSPSWQPDGVLDEAFWSTLPATAMVDTMTGEPVANPTEVRLGWTPEALLLGAWIPDGDLRSTFLDRDDPLWEQECFEVFVFGSAQRRDYLELQITARGVTFDARFERYRDGDVSFSSTWRTAVHRRGTVDDARDRDEGWSLEAAIPWAEICAHTDAPCPPKAGTELRFNTFQFERPRRGPVTAFALSPPRVPDFHAPENAAVLELLP